MIRALADPGRNIRSAVGGNRGWGDCPKTRMLTA